MVRELAIMNSKQRILEWEMVFVISVHNVWEKIKTVLQDLMKLWFVNLIVVNDGSDDDTLSYLKILEDTNRDLILLNHFRSRWEWAALQTWFEYAKRFCNVDYVVTYNSNWYNDIKDLNTFLDAFKKDKNLDIAIGSRFLSWSHTNASFAKKTLLKLGIFFTYITTRVRFTDTHNGYRVIKSESLNKISLTMDGNSYASEVLNIIAKNKLKFKEIPVSVLYDDNKKSRLQGIFGAIEIVLKVLWEKLFR